MKKFCVLVSVALLAAIPMMLLAAADGAALYKEKCSMCHGANGEGNKDTGMPAVKGTKITVEKLTALLFKGDPDMTIHRNPVGQLSEEQSKAVAEFIKKMEESQQ